MPNDNLPPLPEKEQIDKHIPTGIVLRGYTAEQMQAYARAAIEIQSVPDLNRLAPFVSGLGKAILQELIEGMAAIAAAPQPQPVAWLVTGPFEKRSFDMRSFAESYCKGLNKGFGEDVYKISNLVVQSSEPHEKCNDERMCAACYSGQGKCKTQPVQQEPCPECDGTGTVAGSQAHFPCPLCTSPQAQPQPVQEPVAWIERDMNCDDFDPDSVTCQKPDIAAEGWEWVPLYTTPQALAQPQPVPPEGPMAETVEQAARDVAKCLNERDGQGLDLRHVAMLVHYAQQPVQRPAEKAELDRMAKYVSTITQSEIDEADGDRGITSPQAQPLSDDASPIFVLLAVEESIKNGECPWQIEQAFDEYEAQRQSEITKGTT